MLADSRVNYLFQFLKIHANLLLVKVSTIWRTNLHLNFTFSRMHQLLTHVANLKLQQQNFKRDLIPPLQKQDKLS